MDSESSDEQEDELARVKWSESERDWLLQGWRSESGSWSRDKVTHIGTIDLWFVWQLMKFRATLFKYKLNDKKTENNDAKDSKKKIEQLNEM